MPKIYHFEDRTIRVVFIEGKPWLVAEDIGPCIGLESDGLECLTDYWKGDVAPKDTLLIEVPNVAGFPILTRLYSLEMAMDFAMLAERPEADRFRDWLEVELQEGLNPIHAGCGVDTCPHFGILADSMDRGLRALGGVIDMIRKVHESGQDLRTVEPQNLAELLDLVREEFKNTENNILYAYRCANGRERWLAPRART